MNTSQQSAIQLQQGDALIAIDLQNDFLTGGKLEVAQGDQVVAVFNRYIAKFEQCKRPIFLTRDWHPFNHSSFITQGGPWPEHCVAGSKGAEFSSDLIIPDRAIIISSGIGVHQDGYSAFENPAFEKQLQRVRATRLFIGGLATDYCVLNTVCAALQRHYQVLLLKDAIRAVNVQPQDGANAETKMQADGAIIITLDDMQ